MYLCVYCLSDCMSEFSSADTLKERNTCASEKKCFFSEFYFETAFFLTNKKKIMYICRI